MIENKTPVNKKGYTRMIIDAFISKGAINSNNSLSYEDIDLPLPDNEKYFLLNNLIKDDFIKVKADGRMWFDQSFWDKTANKLAMIYLTILIAPILVTSVFIFLFKYFI